MWTGGNVAKYFERALIDSGEGGVAALFPARPPAPRPTAQPPPRDIEFAVMIVRFPVITSRFIAPSNDQHPYCSLFDYTTDASFPEPPYWAQKIRGSKKNPPLSLTPRHEGVRVHAGIFVNMKNWRTTKERVTKETCNSLCMPAYRLTCWWFERRERAQRCEDIWTRLCTRCKM